MNGKLNFDDWIKALKEEFIKNGITDYDIHPEDWREMYDEGDMDPQDAYWEEISAWTND
jgi:hypothetical protein